MCVCVHVCMCVVVSHMLVLNPETPNLSTTLASHVYATVTSNWQLPAFSASSHIQDICSRFQDCVPSLPLEVLTVIGVVLSLIGVVATIVTLLLFK